MISLNWIQEQYIIQFFQFYSIFYDFSTSNILSRALYKMFAELFNKELKAVTD